jgi:probable rRNA maturation factor
MIEIINQQRRHRISLKKFKELLERLNKRYQLGNPEVNLVFVDTKAIKRLNRKFLKKDAPTDVLSFPLGERGADGKFYLGDIVISVPRAWKQSSSKKHSLEKELKLLTIHGFLHLLGYDHSAGIEEEERRVRNLFLEG